MVAGKNAAEMAGEVIEQPKFGSRGGNGLSANGKNHGGGIDFDVADFERARRKWTLKTAQHGLDPGDKFARAEGLGDVIVGSDLKAEDAIRLAALGRQENYRHGGEALSLADVAAKFETVFAGNHDVEHEERGTLALGVGDHSGTVGIDADRKTFVFQVMANEAGNVGIVFDDEDAWFHGLIVTNRLAST